MVSASVKKVIKNFINLHLFIVSIENLVTALVMIENRKAVEISQPPFCFTA
jgi:hypothetical protein